MIHRRIRRQDVEIKNYMLNYYKNMEEEKNYKNPPIPKGFRYVKGQWNNGFTILNEQDGSLFVWQPKEALEANSTEDGYIFNKKFGRNIFDCKNDERYQIDWFYDDAITSKAKKVINTTGGNYISAYIASWKENRIVFSSGLTPMFSSSNKIEKLCKDYAKKLEGVFSMPVSGSDFDCMIKYFMMQSNMDEDLLKDSTKWNAKDSKLTGDIISHYGIFDLGMHEEFTTENNSNFYVVRGGQKSVASRMLCDWKNRNKNAFRVVLYVEPQMDAYGKSIEILEQKLKKYEKTITNEE